MRYTACQQKVRRPGYWVLTRAYSKAGYYDLVEEFVKDTSSTGCRHMGFDTDPACQGCEFPKDVSYIEKMKGLV
jgi:hypothetical protein